MNTNTKMLAAAGLVGLTVAGAGYLWWAAKRAETPEEGEAPAATRQKASVSGKQIAAPSVASATGHIGRASQTLVSRGFVAPTNEVVIKEDRAEADKMQERLDNEDQPAALVSARKLMRSKDDEVRSRVVSTLGWIGVKALPELTSMLSDANEDIASEVFEQWKVAADEISDEVMKANFLALAASMQNITKQDDLEALVMDFNNLPDDLAVRGLVTVIQSSNKTASEVARENYSFVTGEDYTTPAAAEEWITKNVEQPAATTK